MVTLNRKETDYFHARISDVASRPIASIEKPLEQRVFEAAQRVEQIDDLDRLCKEMIGYCIKFQGSDLGEAVEFVGNFLAERMGLVPGFESVTCIGDLYELLGEWFQRYEDWSKNIASNRGYQTSSLDARTELMYLGFFSLHEGAEDMMGIETPGIEVYKLNFRKPIKTHKANAVEDLPFTSQIE